MSSRSLLNVLAGCTLALIGCTSDDGAGADTLESEASGTDSTDEGIDETDETDETSETDDDSEMDMGLEPDMGPPIDPGLPAGPLYGVMNVFADGFPPVTTRLDILDFSLEDGSPSTLLELAGAERISWEGAAFNGSWGLYPVGPEGQNQILVHDLDNAPSGPLTVLEQIPVADNHAIFSHDGSTLAVLSGLHSGDELRVAAIDQGSIGSFSLVPDTPPDILSGAVFSTDGGWLSFASRELGGPDQIHVSEIVEGVPQSPVTLTALEGTERAAPHKIVDDQAFFSVRHVPFISTLYYADLSNWPLVDPQPVFPVDPTLASRWAIDHAGARLIHTHNNDGELLGVADLIEIDGGQVGPAQPLDTGGLVFLRALWFSNNGRFVVLIRGSQQVIVADLDGDDPTKTWQLGSIDYFLDEQVHAVGDWMIWPDASKRLTAVLLVDELGAPITLSPPGVDISDVAVDPNRPQALATSDDGRVWVVDLSGPTPGEMTSVPVAPTPATPVVQFAVPSPLDSWIIYGVFEPGDSNPDIHLWGQDPEVALGRQYHTGPIPNMRLFSPGAGAAQSVF